MQEEYCNEDFFEEDPDVKPVREMPEGMKNGGTGDHGSRFKGKQHTYRKTVERIAYARALLKGKSQRQAFMEAFPRKKETYSIGSIDSEASGLFNDPRFQEEVYQPEAQKMEESLERQFRWSRAKAARMLMVSAQMLYDKVEAEVEKPVDERNTREILNEMRVMKDFIGELNQMHGINQKNLNVEGGFVVLSGEEDLED